jgi:hypothetical protein
MLGNAFFKSRKIAKHGFLAITPSAGVGNGNGLGSGKPDDGDGVTPFLFFELNRFFGGDDKHVVAWSVFSFCTSIP